jgi:hypothetical protein
MRGNECRDEKLGMRTNGRVLEMEM